MPRKLQKPIPNPINVMMLFSLFSLPSPSLILQVYTLFDNNNFFFPSTLDFGVLYFNFMLYLGDVSTE